MADASFQNLYFFFDSLFISVTIGHRQTQDISCFLQVAAQGSIVISIRQVQGLLIQALFHILCGRSSIFQEVDIPYRFT